MARSPMQVDDEFRQTIKNIQKEIMKKDGIFESIPKITREIVKMPEFEAIERKILGNKELNLGIKFDGRKG